MSKSHKCVIMFFPSSSFVHNFYCDATCLCDVFAKAEKFLSIYNVSFSLSEIQSVMIDGERVW